MVVKLGFGGFLDFRKAVLGDLSQQKQTSPLSRMREQTNSDALTNHHEIKGVYHQTINNIETTFANLSPDLILQTAKILANRSRMV